MANFNSHTISLFFIYLNITKIWRIFNQMNSSTTYRILYLNYNILIIYLITSIFFQLKFNNFITFFHAWFESVQSATWNIVATPSGEVDGYSIGTLEWIMFFIWKRDVKHAISETSSSSSSANSSLNGSISDNS